MSDGMDGLDGLSYTTVTPRASLKSDANKYYYNSRNLKNFQVELYMFHRTVFRSTKLSPDMMLTVWRLVED